MGSQPAPRPPGKSASVGGQTISGFNRRGPWASGGGTARGLVRALRVCACAAVGTPVPAFLCAPHSSLSLYSAAGVACGILVPRLGMQAGASCHGRAQSLNHWTSRGACAVCSLQLLLLCVTVQPDPRKVFTEPMEVYAQCCLRVLHLRVSPPASVCTRTSFEAPGAMHTRAHCPPGTVPSVDTDIVLLTCSALMPAPASSIFLWLFLSPSLDVWCVCF